MPDPQVPASAANEATLKGEIVRLNKIMRALMDRAERSTSIQGSDFGLFQTAIMLEGQVRSRTAELEAALHENEEINHALRESEAKFHGLVNQSLVGIAMIEGGKFSYSNAKFDEIFGYRADEIRGLGPLDVTIEEDQPTVAENLRNRMSGAVDHVSYIAQGRRKNGAVIDIEIFGSTMRLGGKLVLISMVMDVTTRTQAERKVLALQERLRELSVRDALTGLYNRRYLEETLGRELIASERRNQNVSVIMGDLDHFKQVNDRHGHLAGDEVLRGFASLMQRMARGSDIVCRYGGEEFLLVLPEMTKTKAVERAEQLRHAVAAMSTAYGASRIAVTASFGVAAFPEDGRTAEQLIAAADTALYVAKAAGRNCVSACPAIAGPKRLTAAGGCSKQRDEATR